VIPFDESDGEIDVDLNAQLETIDLNEDEDLVEFNLRSLSVVTSDEMRVFRDYQQIDEINAAIKTIEKSKECGFDIFGDSNRITRQESIDLIAFSTEEGIFVFDAKPEIAKLLKPILESKSVQKIVFCCRHMSDTLFRLYDIKLENVCDIRIIDYHLQRKLNQVTNAKHKKFSKPVRAELRSLEKCLRIYLAINLPSISNNINYNQLTNRVKNIIRFRILFLREMSIIINFELMKELFISTERCLKSLRSANDIEYQALHEEECELQLMENPINRYEEENIDKKIYRLFV
jgi:hypothetical protein